MNTNFRALFCCWMILSICLACNRTVDFIPPSSGSTSAQEIFQTNEVVISSFKVEATIGDSIVLDDHSGFAPTLLIIPEDLCVYGNGAPCQGEMDVELIQAFGKSDMIFSDIPTTSNHMPLESGGAFYVNITQNGEQLRIRPGALFKIKAPVARTQGESSKMLFYKLKPTGPESYDWSLQGSLASVDEEYYTIVFDQLELWMNIDYELDIPVLDFSVSLVHDEMPVADAEVYIALSDFNSISKAQYQAGSSRYHSLVPQNAELQIVALKKQGEQWFWNKVSAFQGEGALELSLEPVGYETLVSNLKDL